MRISRCALLLVLVGCGQGSAGDHPGDGGGSDGGGGGSGGDGGGDGGAPDAGVAMRNPPAPDAKLSRWVNTLRGSNSDAGYSRGNTFPGVTVPFGFNFFTPITQANSHSWLYAYRDHSLSGFGISHEPSPWIGDHGSLQIMPMTGQLRADAKERASSFSHTRETAQAHYYRVFLDDYGIDAEVTPTDHASAWRFTFPRSDAAFLLFDTIDSVGGSIHVDETRRTISGYTNDGPRLYFFAQVDKEITSVTDSGIATASIGFATADGEAVTMTLATSFISVAQAEKNLLQEVGGASFDEVKERAQALWDATLGYIELEGASDEQKTTFYSNLYRAFMYPNSMWESVDGAAQYFSPYDQQLHAGKIWVNNGFWDTFRAAWPLYTLLMPSQTGEMLQGWVRAFEDGGFTPRWSGPGYIDIMVGSHSDIIFADALAKGLTNFDRAAAYQSMLRNAMTFSDDGAKGRKGNDRSVFLGYIPTDALPESAAWYLEDTINDFGISLMAAALGRNEEADYFRQRSLTYANLFSPSVGFFRGKRADGNWRTSDGDFKPYQWGFEFTEGAPWHYSTAASQDPQGMANLYGGRAALSAKIDAVFAAPRDFDVGSYGGVIHEMTEAYDTNMGQYAHANEPIHHMLYMYNYAGTPQKTQRRVRDVLARLYDSGVGTGNGYLGDEDNGQMSAWYVFSALGFYPASPGHPEYAIGSPLFQKATIHLENGKDFVISAPGNDAQNVFIQSAKLNGATYSKNYLRHEDLVKGGTLELVMGPAESSWGSGAADLPTSITRGDEAPRPLVDLCRGGNSRASADNPGADEGKERAFDDSSMTKWLAMSATATLGYDLAASGAVAFYTLTSGNDYPERDPKDWTLEGSDDGVSWSAVDTRSGESFTWRRQTRVFAVANASVRSYSHYRLNVRANHGGGAVQLAELELLAASR